ncbi:hypothetical protein C8R47DRAFT_976789 [Mycena vitilis]|nr:hypothetical protein C8R47DRAFT_976789 [Mycena vitilis]
MGRRKIEIQPITHERNRSVTFLKACRKNGLFKKAYELGVLCSVDVAVIIFEERPGHHHKLYQYCSTDIRDIVGRHVQYDGERETRGIADFSGAGAKVPVPDAEGDDDEDADEEEVVPPPPKRAKAKISKDDVSWPFYYTGGLFALHVADAFALYVEHHTKRCSRVRGGPYKAPPQKKISGGVHLLLSRLCPRRRVPAAWKARRHGHPSVGAVLYSAKGARSRTSGRGCLRRQASPTGA